MNSSAQTISAHAARPASPALRLDNVSVRYGKQTALQHASFQVEPGQLMALVGPSGCGKSSLLASINRMTDLVPGCVVDGAIVLGEDDVRAPTMAVHQLRRRVGMVLQQLDGAADPAFNGDLGPGHTLEDHAHGGGN